LKKYLHFFPERCRVWRKIHSRSVLFLSEPYKRLKSDGVSAESIPREYLVLIYFFFRFAYNPGELFRVSLHNPHKRVFNRLRSSRYSIVLSSQKYSTVHLDYENQFTSDVACPIPSHPIRELAAVSLFPNLWSQSEFLIDSGNTGTVRHQQGKLGSPFAPGVRQSGLCRTK
jgi:hypothetical protein